MIKKEDLEKIKEETKRFFEKMGFEAEFEFLPQKEEALLIRVEMEDPQPLIGKGGQTLVKVQRLLGVILKRKIKEDFFIDLDINNYKVRKIEFLKELAQKTADQVALTKEEKTLNSMPAYERRIIHLELAERDDVTTESIGEEPERRVIIRPYP